MKTTILLICKTQKTAMSLNYTLNKFDYSIIIESNVDSAIHKVSVNEYSTIILESTDTTLDTVYRIREITEAPLFVLFDTRQQEILFDCFEAGIDDYFIRPYSYTEISYKIKRSVKRTLSKNNKNLISYNTLQVDYDLKVATIEGKRLNLSRTEFEILYYLLVNKNAYLSRKRIYQTIWKRAFFEGDRSVDTHICILRKKIGEYGKHLHSKRNYGYSFDTFIDE